MRAERVSVLDGWVGVHAVPWLFVGLAVYLSAEGVVATAGGVAAFASASVTLVVVCRTLWSSR